MESQIIQLDTSNMSCFCACMPLVAILGFNISSTIHEMMLLSVLQEEKIAVIVESVSDDTRVYEVTVLMVIVLRFDETTRVRLGKYEGECITFDELSLNALLRQNTV